ncbi:MAG: sigma-70 family RNA polymerase sigma factor [Pseudomonadota bacterium]
MLWHRTQNAARASATHGLDSQLEAELGYRARELDDVDARNALVESHLGLVKRIARTYARRGGSYDDLIQEGSLALMRAAQTFEPERKVRFSTYAAFWIRSHMQRHMAWLRSHQYAAPASVAYSGGQSRGHAERRTLLRTVSIDAPIGEDSDQTLGNNLASEVGTPEALVSQRQVRRQLRQVILKSLDELGDARAEVVIHKRLLRDDPATLSEIGDELDMSREGARLLELRLIKKMRIIYDGGAEPCERRELYA